MGMRMTLSLASLAKACTAQEETKLRHPQPKQIEPKAEGVGVNFQVVLIPGFKVSMPTLPSWGTHSGKGQ
jgi:hypothetical protein